MALAAINKKDQYTRYIQLLIYVEPATPISIKKYATQNIFCNL